MRIPQTISGKKLYFSEGIELNFSQFVEVLKIKHSELVIHITTEKVVYLKENLQSLSQFLKMEHGIFILDSTPMMFTDDCGMDNFSEMHTKLKDSLNEDSDSKKTQYKIQEKGNHDKVNRLGSSDYDLFQKIGNSIFGSHNIAEISVPLKVNQSSEEIPIVESLPNNEVEKVILLRRKIQHIEEQIHELEHSPDKKKELEHLLTSYRAEILGIINKQKD